MPPLEVQLRIIEETTKIMRLPEVRKNLEIWGVEPYQSSVDEFTVRYRRDIETFRRVVKEANIKVD
ncbi:MAG: hypothetical protein ACKVQK_31140 [Burkholderiales bacterium]